MKPTIFVCLTGAGSLLLTAPGRAQSIPQYTISTVVGVHSTTGSFGGDNAAATSAQLNSPSGVAYAAGNLYIADEVNNRIRYVSNGTIKTVAGNGTATAGTKQLGDKGQATSAELTTPFGLTVDGSGNIYIADTGDDVVRYVTAAGQITTFAGNYGDGAGYGGDRGLASGALLDHPSSVAIDSSGNVYIADTFNNVIRKVVPGTAAGVGGTITTLAGNNQKGYLGDGGPATSAELYNPEGVAVDSAGNVYIADSFNNVIRKVTVATGIITTVVGVSQVSGVGGFAGDGGPATKALLNNPEAVAVDSAGNLYIADSLNNRIRIVSNGIINTIAGNGSFFYGGDGGPATSAQLYAPSSLALDGKGNIYVADTQNNVIRLLTFTGQSAPAPAPVVNALENAANYSVKSSTNGAAANSFISVYASNLGTASGSNLFPSTNFQGIQVLFNGTPAPLYFVNGALNLINLGVPSNLGTSGTATVNVVTSAGTSANYTLTLTPFDVGIFRLSADPAHSNNGAITIANSQWLVMPASTAKVYGFTACTGLPASSLCGQPAHVGNQISVYFTGGGLATPNGSPSGQPVPSGSVAPANGNPLYETVQTPIVTIGGVTVPSSQVTFSGIAPGTAWEYQINATIPAGVSAGDSVPVAITFGGSSDTVTISVQ